MSDAAAIPLPRGLRVSETQRDVRDQHWSALMAAAQGGDVRAYDTLLRECLPLLRAICRRRIADAGGRRTPAAAGAEEGVRDPRPTPPRARPTYDPPRPFRPWLAAIAERRAVDRLRRHFRNGAREVELTEANGHAALSAHHGEERIAARQLRDAVAELPQAQRDALQLTKIEDLPLAEASKRAGTTVGAMKVATHRALHSLRRRLGPAE